MRMVEHVQHPAFYAKNATWSWVAVNWNNIQPTPLVPDPCITLVAEASSYGNHAVLLSDDPGVVQNSVQIILVPIVFFRGGVDLDCQTRRDAIPTTCNSIKASDATNPAAFAKLAPHSTHQSQKALWAWYVNGPISN